MLTVLLLLISNVFMTFAWYGHLKHPHTSLWAAIIVSWLIAFFEYCFQVPANRVGAGQFSAVQLKLIQEVLTLIVFSVFAVTYLGSRLSWNHLLAFSLVVVAAFLVRADKPLAAKTTSTAETQRQPLP